MKSKQLAIINIYSKMLERALKEKLVHTSDSCFIYFASCYLNKFLEKDLNIKGYIGFKSKDLIKDVFVVMIPIQEMKSKSTKKYFYLFFEEAIRPNERYVGFIKTQDKIGFLFKHDEELLNAYKTGQFSKISEVKKNKMRKFKMLPLHSETPHFEIKILTEKIDIPFFRISQDNMSSLKNYALRKEDLIRYELYKMIYPEIFYPVLAEQFNVKIDYLRKNNVQVMPKSDIDKNYLELSENDNVYWFDKK